MIKKLLAGLKGGRPPGISPPIPHKDPVGAVHWMEAGQEGNPFGVRILNCFSTAMGLLSMTEEAGVAMLYNERRRDDGRGFIGKLPENAVEFSCSPSYPMGGAPSDGPVHVSGEMEDKWDIYLYEGRLYFARSWTGILNFTADIGFTAERAKVHRIVAPRDMSADPMYGVRVVDFIIKSHIYGWRVPAPLAAEANDDPQGNAIALFSLYGVAATREDTISFGPMVGGGDAAKPAPSAPAN